MTDIVSLSQALSSTSTQKLADIDLRFGSQLQSEHFYTASEAWTMYCLARKRHLPLIKQHAWHLLPPLVNRRALFQLLYFGITPPSPVEGLLQEYLETSPTAQEISKACEVVLDSDTAEQLLHYCPTATLTPLAFCNGLRRRITALVTRPVDLSQVVPLLTDKDGSHLSWLLRVRPAAITYKWPHELLVAAQEWELC